MKETEFIAHKKNDRGMNIDRAKMAEVSKVITEKQTDPWNGERPGQDAKKKGKNIITYRRISKRLAVDTSFYWDHVGYPTPLFRNTEKRLP